MPAPARAESLRLVDVGTLYVRHGLAQTTLRRAQSHVFRLRALIEKRDIELELGRRGVKVP